jgi:hypothetical protein
MTPLPSYLYNKNVKLRGIIDPSKSFMLDEISKDHVDEYIHSGSFFNRQRLGMRVKDFERESSISKRYQVVATINNLPHNEVKGIKGVVDDSEFIAIMESFDMPLYFILYDVSYSQFVYSERALVSSGQ